MIMALPPLLVGAVKLTVACVLPPVAVPITGAPGTTIAVGVTLLDVADSSPVPIALVAFTVQVTVEPFVRPVTVMGEVEPVMLTTPHVAV